MNGYLLVCSMTLDDVPLRLFATEDEFNAFMGSKGSWEEDISAALKVLDCEGSEVVCAHLVEFRDGKPVSRKYVMDLGEWLENV